MSWKWPQQSRNAESRTQTKFQLNRSKYGKVLAITHGWNSLMQELPYALRYGKSETTFANRHGGVPRVKVVSESL